MEAPHCTKEQAQAELNDMLSMPNWHTKGPVREPAQFTVEETLVRIFRWCTFVFVCMLGRVVYTGRLQAVHIIFCVDKR
jgi:hypothetical protein